MRTRNALMTCALAAWVCAAETVNISGVVKDSASGTALRGAVVRLAGLGIADTTDAAGSFALVSGQTGVVGAQGLAQPSACVQVLAGGALRIGLAEPGRVKTTGHTVDGRQVMRIDQWLTAGEHVLSLGCRATGVTLFRIHTTDGVFLPRRAGPDEGAAARPVGDEPAGLAKGAEAFSDTIVVTMLGYVMKRVAVSAASTAGLVIMLATVKTTGDNTMVDIEGNVYQTVKIGTQVWMKENLKATKYRDGSPIPRVTDNKAWAALSTPAYCYYENDSVSNKAMHGTIYNWHVVDPANPKKLAPAGWHVPSSADWATLTTYLGGEYVAGGKLKEAGTAHWLPPNTGATNSTGFTALPGGYRMTDGGFHGMGYATYGNFGYWWSSSANVGPPSWSRAVRSQSEALYSGHVDGAHAGFYVRCVRD